ncbi:MAG: hypothetical protein IPJ90_16940 [Anaerolineaceae bacterium]|nr:hypothetical protein [Anaerolineaceae bacterium]
MSTAVPTGVPATLPPLPTTAAIPTAAPPVTAASFADQVVQAFNNADYAWINAHMGSEFTFAGWQAGGSALPPAAAVDQLRTVYFGSGSTPIFQTGIDTTAVLGGVDPLSLWGPETAVTDVLYVTGLGSSAHDEAMIILATDNAGTPYIFGMLNAFGGFGGFAGYPNG